MFRLVPLDPFVQTQLLVQLVRCGHVMSIHQFVDLSANLCQYFESEFIDVRGARVEFALQNLDHFGH